ncbi:MAG: histidine kinase [Carboxylicivirga sp.]|jgi:ligand-binding sensor domain-containing protein|nr:histidine kinase [Carboxylicivirga sp.]
MVKTFFLGLLLLVVSLLSIIGQTHPVRHFTDKDGLPNNNVKAVHKDSRGTLWIATNAGLCTFDGKEFKPFDFKGYNKSNKVWAIEEDEFGNMYFGTFGGEGLIKYNGKQFTTFICDTSKRSNHIRNLKYSKKRKCLYIGTEDGLSILRDTTLTHFTLLAENGFRHERAMCFFESGDSLFVHTFTGGTYYYLHSANTIQRLRKEHPYYQYSSSQTAIDSRGNIIQGIFRNGLKVFKPDSTFEYYDLGQVFDIEENKNGALWLAAWSYYNMKEPGGFFRIENDSLEWLNPILDIDYKMAWCVEFDEEQDAYWLGTDGNGLYLYKDNGVTVYDASYFGLEELKVYDIKDVNGELFFTANNNLIICNEEKGFKTYSDDEIINKSEPYKLLIGTDLNELIKRVTPEQTVPNSIAKLYSIEQHHDEIWIGAVLGYFVINKDEEGFDYRPSHRIMCENFKFLNDTSIYGAGYGLHRIIPNYSYDIAFEPILVENTPKDINRIVQVDDELWFSSWNRGLYHFKDGEYLNYSVGIPEIPLNQTDLCIDNYSNLIAGSNDGQVHIMKYESDSISILHKIKDEIKGNSVQWLLADSKNNLWIGTNLGLNVLSLDSLYDEGIIFNRFYDDVEGFKERDIRTSIEDSKGNIWIGGKDALIKINPHKFLTRTVENKVKLTNILVNNQQFDWEEYDITTSQWNNLPKSNFILPHHENSFVFEFETNNQYNADKEVYSFKLEGFDKEFSSWQGVNKAVYTNLDAGKYQLIVKSKNRSTGQLGTPIEYSFRITPPWWTTWWFYTTVAFAIIGSVWFYLNYRIRKVKSDSEKQKQLDEQISSLKTQAIQAQMNPHFIFNAITSVQSFMLSNDNETALDYLMLFANLIRKTLDLVSEKTISLQTELEYLDNYIKIESMRFENGIDYSLKVDGGVDVEEINIPPLLLQPFVENAIKHGLAVSKMEKKLRLNVTQVNGLIQVTIQDNGIGYDKSLEMKKDNRTEHNSKGLAMAEERIRQIEGYTSECGLRIEDLSQGTSVNIKMPL